MGWPTRRSVCFMSANNKSLIFPLVWLPCHALRCLYTCTCVRWSNIPRVFIHGFFLSGIGHLPSLKTCRMYFKLCFFYESLNHTHVPKPLVVSVFLTTFRCFALEPTLTLSCFLLSVVLVPYDVVHAPSVQIFKCRLKQYLGM